MALIIWNDNLSVQVAELDGQHQKLIAMINALTEAIKLGRAPAVIEKVVQGLIDYSQIHFQTEEKYFAQFGYPQAERHIQEHEAFTQRVARFKNGPTEGETSLSIQVLQFLGDWLIHHIMGTDKAYVEFFNAKGLK